MIRLTADVGMATLLFIYGTLHPDRAPAEIATAARRLTLIGHGTIRARLYDLGDYPGAIPDATAEAIAGHVFSVPDQATLAQLDDYEDFRLDDPAAGLFLREEAVVTLDDGSQQSCYVYTYNRGASHHARVEQSDR